MGGLLAIFQGWNNLSQNSPDIIIAQCDHTPATGMNDGLVDSPVQVLTVLKGVTNLGPARLISQYWPRQGEQYLIFALYHDGVYQANEGYNVVPLGLFRPLDLSTGKTLDEKIKILLQRSLDNLNRQMKAEQEEKQRLEEGLKK